MTIFEQIGEDKIREIVRAFYDKAVTDPMIGYFFFGKDHEHLIKQQSAFTIGLLGGPTQYSGRPLASVHKPLGIRSGHFGRRQVILEEVLNEHDIKEPLRSQWLSLENQLRPIILGMGSCDT